MTTPYYVDLFYEDVGFTNDYSNVLQFNSKEEREAYFDNIAHYRMENTDFNNMNITGNTIKIAFYDLQSVDLDEINYLRIATRLYGTSTTIDTLEYGFVIDYSVISSTEDCTVVSFTFEKDIWMNYQFNFELKECNVERSHMDRWEGNEDKYIVCKDAIDSVSDIEDVKWSTKSLVDQYYGVKEGSNYIESISVDDAKILWAIVTFTSSQGTLPDRVTMALFPISIHPNENEGKESVSNTNPFKNRRIPQNFNVTAGTGAYYPSLIDIENGNINQIVAKIGGQSQIVNIQYMGDSPFTLKRNIEDNVYFNQVYHGDDPLETIITASQVEVYDIDDNYQPITQTRTFRVVVISPDVVRDIDSYKLYTFKSQEYAIKPVDGDNYNENHEPMLYRTPIRQYYVCSADNKEYYQINDKFLDIKSDDRFKCNIVTSISAASSLIFYNNVKREESKDLANVIVDNAFSFNAINGSVLNDEFINYCVQQKSVDRQMCMVNMLTGGMSDAGSTAISAGIGYRSNMERSELAQIRSTWSNPGVSESNMYSRYAKQAAGMSIGGGALQMGANAINTYMSQKAKEKSIMNTPGKIGQTTDIAAVIRISNDENSWSYLVTTKVDETAYELYRNIFNKFGYAIYGVINPDIKSRKYFNYIKTAGAILTGNVNQAILANLAVLFDRGMTIWHMDYTTKETLYDYTKENIERTLLAQTVHLECTESEYTSLEIPPAIKKGSTLEITEVQHLIINALVVQITKPDGTHTSRTIVDTNNVISYTFDTVGEYVLTKLVPGESEYTVKNVRVLE